MSIYTVVVSLGTPSDEAACNEIALLSKYTRGFAKPSRMFAAKREVAFTTEQCVWVAKNKAGRVMGFCWSRPMLPRHMPWSTLYDVAVHPQFQRRGVAERLVRHALMNAKGGELRLLVEETNTGAKALYKKLGFTAYDVGQFSDGRWFARMKKNADPE